MRDPAAAQRSDTLSGARLLDAVEVGERLNLTAAWVRRRAKAGDLPCVRLGRYVRFEAATVEQWLKAHRAGVNDRSHE
jgi:excisionase family DNA binding protein